MTTIELSDFADDFLYEWIRELISNGKSFPDFRDGLKDSSRSIITEVARQSEFRIKPIGAPPLIGAISNYREGSEETVMKNLYRLANSNAPVVKITTEDLGVAPGLNRVTGGHSKPRYLRLTLTPLGKYIFKYRDYFKQIPTDTDANITKYESIDTPFPLSLAIPQSNLSEGFSTKAPALNAVETINAYIEHLMKDKQTTTEDLAKHISGFEMTNGHTILTSNQGIYDFIERGVMKTVTLSPIEIYKDEIIIKELPYKQYGNSIRKNINDIHEKGLEHPPSGFVTFHVTSILAEDSDDSIITIGYKPRAGYTAEDIREELYTKTKLKERLVYENFVLDHTSDKPLKIMSIRKVLDYHVDLGIQLKTREVQDALYDLEAKREEALFLEKVTRETCIAIIGKIIGWETREKYVRIYLPQLHQLMIDLGTGKKSVSSESDLGDFYLIHYTIKEQLERLSALTEKEHGTFTTENFIKVIDAEIPNEFSDKELGRVWRKEYEVLYDLNKRDLAIITIQNYNENLKKLTDKLLLENIKIELKNEMLELRKHYEGKKFSTTLYALREQEREFRKREKREMNKVVRELTKEFPVNVLVGEDNGISVRFKLDADVGKPKKFFECTNKDSIIVLCREGRSYRVPVAELEKEPTYVSSPENILTFLIDAPTYHYHIFLTNKGRASIVSSKAFKFKARQLDIALAEGERFVFTETIPASFICDQVSLVALTDDGKFKRKMLSEFTVKESLGELFNMFSGPSACENINQGFLNVTTDMSLTLWNGVLTTVPTQGGLKRNVSMGEKVNLGTANGIYIGDKIPVYGGKVVHNLSEILGNGIYKRPSHILLDVDNELNHGFTEVSSPLDLSWAKLETSESRYNFKVSDKLTEAQLKEILGRL